MHGKLLRCNEVADALALKPATIRRWILGRKIAVVRVSPRAVRVPFSEIERIIRERTVPAREVKS
jgi:predicted DNA-binding transcriptional regulator AlpA